MARICIPCYSTAPTPTQAETTVNIQISTLFSSIKIQLYEIRWFKIKT